MFCNGGSGWKECCISSFSHRFYRVQAFPSCVNRSLQKCFFVIHSPKDHPRRTRNLSTATHFHPERPWVRGRAAEASLLCSIVLKVFFKVSPWQSRAHFFPWEAVLGMKIICGAFEVQKHGFSNHQPLPSPRYIPAWWLCGTFLLSYKNHSKGPRHARYCKWDPWSRWHRQGWGRCFLRFLCSRWLLGAAKSPRIHPSGW